MSEFKKHLAEMMEDPEFLQEWEKIQPEMDVVRAIVAARAETNITQKELAERSGIRQSNISRIENGSCSPTVATLQQLANGMGKKLRIEFI